MKILLVCEQPLPSKKRAGRPNYTVRYLAKKGHDITVLCPRTHEEDDGLARYEYINIEFRQFSIINRIKILREFQKKIKKLMYSEKFDIIRTINIIPTYSSLNTKIPIYSEINDFLSDLYLQFNMPLKNIISNFIKMMENKIAKKMCYANVETDVGRRFWKELGANEKKIAAIPNGVDTKHFDPYKANAEEIREKYKLNHAKVLFYHGDIGYYDGLHFLLNIMDRIDAKFMIVGDGPNGYLDELRKIALKNKVEDKIIFTGWIDYGILPSYIACADLCALPLIPKTRENRAVIHSKIKEYLSMGKKFVVTRLEGIESSLGSLPFYVNEPWNREELLNVIKRAFEEERDVEKMRSIAKILDWENIINQDEKVMKAILDGEEDIRKFDLKLENT
ncbi:MAG TPA: glycosyltransferase [Geobacterales bacterium]|nr:glycosyltransferase [Geobacterales bacterium]